MLLGGFAAIAVNRLATGHTIRLHLLLKILLHCVTVTSDLG